jgi:glutathionyl-hydroquinone reductase
MVAQFPREHSDAGEFVRQEDAFRSWIRADGTGDFPAARGRYHLYYTHDEINQTRIVPIGPELDLTSAHGREALP